MQQRGSLEVLRQRRGGGVGFGLHQARQRHCGVHLARADRPADRGEPARAGHYAAAIRRAIQAHHHEVLQYPVAPDSGDQLLVRGFAGADPAHVLLLQLQAIEGSGLYDTHTIPLCTCVIITVMVS